MLYMHLAFNSGMLFYKKLILLIFYIYFRPENGKCAALYLRPLKYSKLSPWYEDAPVGVHVLNTENRCQAM